MQVMDIYGNFALVVLNIHQSDCMWSMRTVRLFDRYGLTVEQTIRSLCRYI